MPDNNNAKSGKFSDLNELSGFASVSDTLLLQTCAGSCCRPRSRGQWGRAVGVTLLTSVEVTAKKISKTKWLTCFEYL